MHPNFVILDESVDVLIFEMHLLVQSLSFNETLIFVTLFQCIWVQQIYSSLNFFPK